MAQLPIRNLRLRAFTQDKLAITAAEQGEVYYDRDADTLRVYNGSAIGGQSLARSDLDNVSLESFVDRATAAGLFGPNIHIHNVTNNQDSGYDYVTFGIGTADVTALYLTRYVGVDGVSWFGIQEGVTWTAGLNPALMLLQSHFGPGAPLGYRVGNNVLAVTGTVLEANTSYTMRIQQTGSRLTEYAFSTNPNWQPSTADLPGDYSGNPLSPTKIYTQGGGSAGSGDVIGPNSSTDNSLARWDQATGKLLQNSLVTVSDLGAITAPVVGNVIPFFYASQLDFPSAADNHGAVAHSHSDGHLYYAHGGQWVRLADSSEIPGLGNLSFGTGSITTTDSSAITVVPQTQFLSDVRTDGDLLLTGSGQRKLGTADLGEIVFKLQEIDINTIADQDFLVRTFNGATRYEWRFDSGGDLIFPNGTVQTTAFTGTVGSINILTDVDTTTTPPTVGQVLKWNGSNWVPAVDATVGGAGTDADTLDGLDSSYFLNFNNLSNKPGIFNTVSVAGQASVVADSVTDTLTLVAGTGMNITSNAGTDTITIATTVVDTNTTYSVSAETATGGAYLRLTDSDAVTDDVKIAQGNNVTVTRTDANTITIASSYTDTNTTYGISAETNAAGADIRLTGSDASTDNLTIAAGANVTVTRTDANTITIASTASGGGGGTVTSVSVASSNGFAGTVANNTTTPAITISTTLTGLLKGNGTSLLTATSGTDYQAPITLTTTGSSGAATLVGNTLNVPQYTASTTYAALTDVVSSGITIDKIAMPAITMLTVTAPTSAAYLFDQYPGNNPTIYAIAGTTIAFNLAWPGGLHPFLIQSSGSNYSTGLVHVTTAGVVTTGANAQGKNNGTLYWKIPSNASGTYTYQCSSHFSMVGTITVKDFAAL